MKLRELKRGMKCTYRNGVEFIVSSTSDGEIEYLDRDIEDERSWDVRKRVLEMNNDLTHKSINGLDIVKVEDITLDGYKTIWEREEDRYYLKLPIEYSNNYVLNYGCLSDKFYFESRDEGSHHKTKFTLTEIEKLPNQDFIQSLEKELVE